LCGKGNAFPLGLKCAKVGAMNLQLSDERIRATCRELKKKHENVSGRGLCEELRSRFGAVGKTTRVFRIWREECGLELAPKPAAQLPADVFLLQRRVEAAEALANQYLQRAELAEFRERAHQEHWAVEIDRLRQELAVLRGPGRILPV
jgi:Plasmid replication region DNA-binding N-term